VLYSNRAACFLKLGQHEKAEEDAAKALSINPSNLKANFRKGLALHAMGQYYTALPVLAQAHKMEPKNKQIKQALQFCEIRIQQDQRKKS
jgi:tetratricopeptide (TPR) repeat protein